MRFRDFGGTLQPLVATESELAELDRLDPALWVATSAPVADFRCDREVFRFLDAGAGGRLRVEQIIAARDWLFARLANRRQLVAGSDVLILDDLATTEEGSALRQAAAHVCEKLALPDATRLSLESLRHFRRGCTKLLENGDGVVPPEQAPNAEIASFLGDVIAVLGGTSDASGLTGVDEGRVDRFVEGARAWLAWRAEGLEKGMRPFGGRTGALADLVRELDPKVREYFSLCSLLRQTGRSTEALVPPDEELRKIVAGPGTEMESWLVRAPLAPPRPNGRLTLDATVNGFYAPRLAILRSEVVARLFDADTWVLTQESWERVTATFQRWEEWRARKPAGAFETLSEDRVTAAVDGALAGRAKMLMARDKAAAPELSQLDVLEKVILLQRWLVELVNNFASFSALYDPGQESLLEDGSLVLDGRRLDFVLRVRDRASHRKMAAESGIFLVYVAVSEGTAEAPGYEVVAPVTSGERGGLRIGKRGIHIDRSGVQRDATVVDLVENAISVPEAIWQPFHRISTFVSKRVESLAGTQLESRVSATTDELGKVAAPPQQKAGGIGLQNLLLGGGIAVAALGSSLALAASALSRVSPWHAVESALVTLAALAALGALLGWLRLRRRDMAPLLEANGWALNARMKITRRLGNLFTRVPPLPPGAIIERRHLPSLKAPRNSLPSS